jgi:hypothetical protein
MSSFGEGEGELLTLQYPKPLPMRLDRWLVAQRPEQSRARIQKFIEAGYVRVNGITGRAKTPGLVERDLAWVAHSLLRPTAATRIPAGATAVKLGDAAVTFARPQTPGAAGIVWSRATMRWRRRTP